MHLEPIHSQPIDNSHNIVDSTLADLNETSTRDKKSLRFITGKSPQWGELAKDVVCFANARGGHILIGIEDNDTLPPNTQSISPLLIDQLNKRIREQTVNVELMPQIKIASNGGEYIDLWVVRSQNIASTRDGRYYLRIGDECKPIIGDDVLRLATDRVTLSWETQTNLDIPKTKTDPHKLQIFIQQIKASDRVKPSVKEKTADELLDHYSRPRRQTHQFRDSLFGATGRSGQTQHSTDRTIY